MKIIYKCEMDEDIAYKVFEYIEFDKLRFINIDPDNYPSVVSIGSDNVVSDYSISFPTNFVASRVAEYILQCYIKKVGVVDLTEFVERMEGLEVQVQESKKKKRELLDERREAAKNGLSFPEYEFMEGALSLDMDIKGALSMEDK